MNHRWYGLWRRGVRGAGMLCSLLRLGEWSRLRPAPIMLLCHDLNRGYVHGGRHYAQLLDSLNERFQAEGIETITVAMPYAEIAGEAAYGTVVTVNGPILRAVAVDRIKRWVGLAVRPDNRRAAIWDRILDRIRPRFVLAIQPTPEFCVAAHARKVPIFDLQHGLVTDELGYYGRHYREKYQQAGWPSAVLCWDRESAESLRRWAPAAVKSRVIGNPWMLRFIEVRPSDELVARAVAAVPVFPGRKMVLVTLQWDMERFGDYDITGLPAALRELILESVPDVAWWIRLHPVQLQEPVRSQVRRRLQDIFGGQTFVEWDRSSEAPLPALLGRAAVHLTVHSAVTVDAACFGVPTGLLDSRVALLREWFSRDLAAGTAEIVTPETTAIRDWLHRKLQVSESLPSGRAQGTTDDLTAFVTEMVGVARGRPLKMEVGVQ